KSPSLTAVPKARMVCWATPSRHRLDAGALLFGAFSPTRALCKSVRRKPASCPAPGMYSGENRLVGAPSSAVREQVQLKAHRAPKTENRELRMRVTLAPCPSSRAAGQTFASSSELGPGAV